MSCKQKVTASNDYTCKTGTTIAKKKIPKIAKYSIALRIVLEYIQHRTAARTSCKQWPCDVATHRENSGRSSPGARLYGHLDRARAQHAGSCSAGVACGKELVVPQVMSPASARGCGPSSTRASKPGSTSACINTQLSDHIPLLTLCRRAPHEAGRQRQFLPFRMSSACVRGWDERSVRT